MHKKFGRRLLLFYFYEKLKDVISKRVYMLVDWTERFLLSRDWVQTKQNQCSTCKVWSAFELNIARWNRHVLPSLIWSTLVTCHLIKNSILRSDWMVLRYACTTRVFKKEKTNFFTKSIRNLVKKKINSHNFFSQI